MNSDEMTKSRGKAFGTIVEMFVSPGDKLKIFRDHPGPGEAHWSIVMSEHDIKPMTYIRAALLTFESDHDAAAVLFDEFGEIIGELEAEFVPWVLNYQI